MLTQRTKRAPPLDAHRVGDGQREEHPALQDGHQVARHRAESQLAGQQPLQDDRDDDADGDRPARLSPGAAPPGGQVARGLVLDVLGPGDQRVPDGVAAPARARRAGHPVGAGAARALGGGGRGGGPGGPGGLGPGAGPVRHGVARDGVAGTVSSGTVSLGTGPFGPGPGAGPSEALVPGGGSGCIYPLLTWSGHALVSLPLHSARALLPRRGEPWRSVSAKTIWSWPRRYADGPSGTADPTWSGPPQNRAGRNPPGRAVTPACCGPALAAQGLLGLHLPEESGGQGYGLSELAVALEELGHALVPGGFLPTVLASALLAAAQPADGRPGRRDGQTAGRAGGRVDGPGPSRWPPG